MWAFLPGGLLMPATLPSLRHDGVEVAKKWTHGGKFDLQVRGRVRSHLTNFIRDYMDPMKLEHSGIQATPNMDYDFRFYCRKEDFASAMAAAVMDIDYQKFKPTAERKGADNKPLYKDGRKYHDLLNSLWGSIARLGNPYGARRGGNYWGGGSSLDRAPVQTFRDPKPIVITEPPLIYPTPDQAAEELFKLLKNVPHAEWGDFAPAEELENVERWLEQTGQTEAVHADHHAEHSIDQEPPF